MATAKSAGTKSIAGKSHGAKSATTHATSTSRWYPQLDGVPGVHPEVAKAIRIILDQQYQQHEQQGKLQSSVDEVSKNVASGSSSAGKDGKSAVPDSAQATGIHGIRINANTDPTSLKNGFTIRYNTTSGQFEFGM